MSLQLEVPQKKTLGQDDFKDSAPDHDPHWVQPSRMVVRTGGVWTPLDASIDPTLTDNAGRPTQLSVDDEGAEDDDEEEELDGDYGTLEDYDGITDVIEVKSPGAPGARTGGPQSSPGSKGPQAGAKLAELIAASRGGAGGPQPSPTGQSSMITTEAGHIGVAAPDKELVAVQREKLKAVEEMVASRRHQAAKDLNQAAKERDRMARARLRDIKQPLKRELIQPYASILAGFRNNEGNLHTPVSRYFNESSGKSSRGANREIRVEVARQRREVLVSREKMRSAVVQTEVDETEGYRPPVAKDESGNPLWRLV